ncbi:cytochrome P450 [Dactylosporangium vinaceum]|uniref:Cytochrome P450 n=1 Tax=Dactylosporangium vinaceum TaxID=53362 RepID=A0ABV5MCM5_9ACTN|nr:cytochrome P450 [Dactylosporangium vinaceum]UAC00967.1 cytochrome P450 [Dactylosporangium vinaceum]
MSVTGTEYSPDLTSDEFQTNPWPIYQRLRNTDPVHYSAQASAFLVVKHADVAAALSDRRLISDFPMRASRRLYGPTVLDSEGQQHREMRQLFAPMFGVSGVRRWREEILVPVVEEVLDAVGDATEVDFAEQIAVAVPYGVVTRLLGLPPGDAPWIRPRVKPLAGVIDLPPAPLDDARAAKKELADYWEHLLTERVTGERPTLIDLLVPPGQAVDPAQLSTAILFLLAGTETSVATISTVMHTVLAHGIEPDALLDDRFRTQVLRETLRWEPPTHSVLRYAATSMEIRGVRIPRRAALLLSLGSANRDEEAFADPDTWRPERTETRNLTFGAGPHTCLGIQLAMAEFDVLFERMARRYGRLRPGAPLAALRGHVFRAPEHLRLAWQRRERIA